MAVGSAWVGSGDIIDGGVHANDIGKMAVTKTKIKTGAVNKIASRAVNQYKIADGAVTPAKLSQNYANLSHSHTYASTSHNHDSRYYTWQETNALDDALFDYIVVIDDLLLDYINGLHGLRLSETQELKAKGRALRAELLNSRDKLSQ